MDIAFYAEVESVILSFPQIVFIRIESEIGGHVDVCQKILGFLDEIIEISAEPVAEKREIHAYIVFSGPLPFQFRIAESSDDRTCITLVREGTPVRTH